MTTENQQVTGVSSGKEGQTTTQKVEPKIEIKDGAVLMDGKKLVPESDLIAAKKSLESAAEKAQAAHTDAIDSVRLELSAEQKKVADLNAKLSSQNALGQGATEDVAKVKQDLANALKRVEALTADAGKSLEFRRKLLMTQFPGVTEETLANKSMVELDSLEVALKAVTSSRGGGIGPYATGGGLGQAAPLSDMDRAKKLLEVTPVRGVRNAPAQ